MTATTATANRLQRAVQIITSRNDLVLAFFLVAVIFMMILPLPTWLVDALIGINMTISAILLMVAMYLPSPLAFSSFPSVLLVTTLFRLGISIATTRLILLQGDAGHIIFTFGNFVVGGNLVVGLVVFLILTIVQFVVITKGAERVAEVAARFSLDAMPGKQMSIDGDMRAGTIDMEEAKRRRGIVEKESQLYGAMDGAMKFVKGDAIAGLIIVAVNLLGGIVIGTMQRGMTAADAAKTYSVLTIGDGLIAQIPALFIAICAGMIVTRVQSGDGPSNVGKDIGQQVMAQPRALMIAEHFARNPKDNPLLVTVLALFGQFKELFVVNYLRWLSRHKGTAFPPDTELMRILKKSNVYVIGEIKQNAANWDNRKVFNILGLLREYDAKSKGMNAGGASDGELLRELLLKIFTP